MDHEIDEARIGVDGERALLGGFLGVAAMIAWIRAAWLLGFPPLEGGSLLGSMLVGNLLHSDENAHLILGGLLHVIMGAIVLALLYAQVEPRMPTTEPGLNGLIYALALWLVGQGLIAPLLGGMAGLDYGLFGLGQGAMGLVGGLAGHLLYGLILGTVYGHHVMPKTIRSRLPA